MGEQEEIGEPAAVALPAAPAPCAPRAPYSFDRAAQSSCTAALQMREVEGVMGQSGGHRARARPMRGGREGGGS